MKTTAFYPLTLVLLCIASNSVNASPGHASEPRAGDQHRHHMHMGQDEHMTSGMVASGHHRSVAGAPGIESKVDRTIYVEANDLMRFEHEPLVISEGETIKFVVTNTGKIPHEFSIASKEEHYRHGQMMKQLPMMQHGDGGASVTLNPGETKNLVWRFSKANDLEIACNIPGHYEAGMHSGIKLN